MQFPHSIEIHAPIETVFELLDDDEKMKLWMEGLEETTYPDGEPEGDPVGVRFIQVIKEGRRQQAYEGMVTAYDKPEYLQVKIFHEKVFEILVDYQLTSIPTGTRLDYLATFRGANLFIRIMGVLFRWMTKRILRKQMHALKTQAEIAADSAD